MRPRRLTSLAALVLAASCTSRDAGTTRARSGDSSAPDSAAAPATIAWFDSVAPLILAPAHSNDRALVVAADSLAAPLEEGTLQQPGTLVHLDGSTEPVRVSLSSGSEGCMDGALDPAPASSWGVGFVGRAPKGIQVDSMRSISRKDSAALAPVIFRLASGIPNDPGGRFAGLPFSLVDLWRVRMPDGATVVVATTRRQINQEDSPLEERTLLVAEADQSGSSTLGYSSRATGPEETVEGSELLAVVTFDDRNVELAFSHDFGEESSYSLVERTGPMKWTRRWTSRRFNC
jgi:hypothetical protein